MRKNKTLRAAALLLILVLITSCFVGGTFAKYTSSKNATANADIARWSVSVNNTDITSADTTLNLNLFDTIIDTVNGSARGENETKNVADGFIAPGTKGSFEIKVKNDSDVTANISVSASAAEGNLPFTFTVTEGGNIAIGAEKTFTVTWEWAFGSNTNDTEWQGKTNIPVTVTITANQVD